MEVLQVGQIIRPEIHDRDVRNLVTRLYGFEVTRYTELNSYDDRNYHIFVKNSSINPNIKTVSNNGYVLKILNSMDSKKQRGLIERQHYFMRRLRDDGINTPTPLPNMHGELMSLEKVPHYKESEAGVYTEHVVRLFIFIPGRRISEVRYTPHLMNQAGRLLGRIHYSSQGFHFPSFSQHRTIWDLREMPLLTKFLHAVQDEINRSTCKDVIDEFQNTVVPKYSQLRKGLIHGDPNEQNILVTKTRGSEGYHICGLLDFSDIMFSYYVFDVALLIAYFMLDATTMDRNDVGGHILAGYSTICCIPDIELRVLKTCMKARLCQSLVLGEYTMSLHPENPYVQESSESKWAVLNGLCSEDNGHFLGHWKSMIKSDTNNNVKEN